MKMTRILLHQFWGKRCKIIFTLANYQKSSGNHIIHLTMFIVQSAIQRKVIQLSFIVINDGNWIIKRIGRCNRATDSVLKILQLCADCDILRILTGLN